MKQSSLGAQCDLKHEARSLYLCLWMMFFMEVALHTDKLLEIYFIEGLQTCYGLHTV